MVSSAAVIAGARHHGSLRRVRSLICALVLAGASIACVIVDVSALKLTGVAPPAVYAHWSTDAEHGHGAWTRCRVNPIPKEYHRDGSGRAYPGVTLATSSDLRRKSTCSSSRFSATASCAAMWVTPASGSTLCGRPAASSADDSRSECATTTLSSASPWMISSGRDSLWASGSSELRSYPSGLSSG